MSISQDYSLKRPTHLAAICTENSARADVIIDQVVDKLLSEGKKIAGMRQFSTDASALACAAQLQDIESGECHRITQARGSKSDSWNMDSDAIEKVAHTLADRLSSDLDMVIVNRFGRRESVGGGFCCVIQRALELDIPVLTVVMPQWQQRWHDYTDAYVVTLPANCSCVLEWCCASIGCSLRSETTIGNQQQEDAFTA